MYEARFTYNQELARRRGSCSQLGGGDQESPWYGAGLTASRLKTQGETIFQFKSKGRGNLFTSSEAGRQEKFSGAPGPATAPSSLNLLG